MAAHIASTVRKQEEVKLTVHQLVCLLLSPVTSVLRMLQLAFLGLFFQSQLT